MPSSYSLKRLHRLTSQVRRDLRGGGMGVTFRYLFRSTTVLARVVEVLSDHVARQATLIEQLEAREAELHASQQELARRLSRLEGAATNPRRERVRREEHAG